MPKFTPVKPFELYEVGTHGGAPRKTSAFIRDIVRDHINMGGILVNVYRLKGTFAQERDALGVRHDDKGSKEEATRVGTFLGLQDTVLGENRDREYDFEEIPMLKGVYQISQFELEYAKFGMALANDIITLEIHVGTMENELGRRLMPGDVIEMPHLRDVDQNGRVANKWYEVRKHAWAPNGYDPMWIRHIMGVVLKPLRHQQEFLDLFERKDQYGKTLADQASTLNQDMALTEANQALANEHARTTWFDTTMMWFDPDHPRRKPYRWNDDGKPDNGLPVSQGTRFPVGAVEGDWFLRIDLVPNRLYRLQGGKWKLREIDNKREWQPYNWTAKLRDHMRDRSDRDRERKFELRSIHDVITEREERSDPTGDELERKTKGLHTT